MLTIFREMISISYSPFPGKYSQKYFDFLFPGKYSQKHFNFLFPGKYSQKYFNFLFPRKYSQKYSQNYFDFPVATIVMAEDCIGFRKML